MTWHHYWYDRRLLREKSVLRNPEVSQLCAATGMQELPLRAFSVGGTKTTHGPAAPQGHGGCCCLCCRGSGALWWGDGRERAGMVQRGNTRDPDSCGGHRAVSRSKKLRFGDVSGQGRRQCWKGTGKLSSAQACARRPFPFTVFRGFFFFFT